MLNMETEYVNKDMEREIIFQTDKYRLFNKYLFEGIYYLFTKISFLRLVSCNQKTVSPATRLWLYDDQGHIYTVADHLAEET